MRPQAQRPVRAMQMSPVLKRSSGMPRTPSVVMTTSPSCPSGTGLFCSSSSSTRSMSAGTCPPQWCPHSVIEVCISVEAYVEKSSSSGHSSVIFAPSVLLLKSVSRSASPMQIARRSDERR